MLGNPEYKKVDRHNKIRSIVNCLRFNNAHGILSPTKIGIKNEDTIIALELGSFFEMVKLKGESLDETNSYRKTYIQYGFIESEGIKDIL